MVSEVNKVIPLRPTLNRIQALKISIAELERHTQSFVKMLKLAADSNSDGYADWKLLATSIGNHLRDAEETEVVAFTNVLIDLASTFHRECQSRGLETEPWPVDVKQFVDCHADDLVFLGWTYNEADDAYLRLLHEGAESHDAAVKAVKP